MKNSFMTLGITTIAAALSLVGCSTTTNSTATNSTHSTSTTAQPMTVITDSSLAMLPDSYLAANATVDKFLNDWLTYSKDGVALLDSHAKQGSTATQLQKYFTQLINPTHSSYEVVGSKKVSDTEYQFHVWMYGRVPGTYGPKGRPRPAPETITVVKQDNKWYIDNLPKVY